MRGQPQLLKASRTRLFQPGSLNFPLCLQPGLVKRQALPKLALLLLELLRSQPNFGLVASLRDVEAPAFQRRLLLDLLRTNVQIAGCQTKLLKTAGLLFLHLRGKLLPRGRELRFLQRQRPPFQLGLLLQLARTDIDFRRVTSLLEIKAPALKLCFLRQLLGAKSQFLRIDAQRLQAGRLRLGHLRGELLALRLKASLFDGQRASLQGRFLLELLGAQPKILLLNAKAAQPQLTLEFLLDVELPLLFGSGNTELLALLGKPLPLQRILRLVLRFLNAELTTLQGGVLLDLLRPQRQFLRRKPKLLDARNLLFGQLQPELLGLLLELLVAKAKFLLRDAQLRRKLRLLLRLRLGKLLLLHLKPRFLNGQRPPLQGRLLLQLLGAEVDFLLLDPQPAKAKLALQLLLDVKLPTLFRLLLRRQRLRATDLPRQLTKTELLTQRQFRRRQLPLLLQLRGLQRLLTIELILALPELRRRQPLLKLLGLPNTPRLKLR